MVLAVISLALLSFSQYKKTLDDVAQHQVHALMSATRLVQQAEGMVNASAFLLLADNHFKRRQAVFEIEDRKEWIESLIADFSAYRGIQVDFSQVGQLNQALFSNLNRINTLVSQRIDRRVDVYFQEGVTREDVRQLELINAEIGEMIRANHELSQDLTVTVGQQVSHIREEILSEVKAIHQDMATREIWLLYAGGLAFLVVLLIAFYINRSVVGRIIQLQKALSLDRPKPQDIPVTGKDEIAWMAQSVHRYVDKINAHERQILEINAELSFLATHDALTKLYNRHYFDRKINEMSRGSENGFFCAAMIDIDWFKSVNDRYGHDVGDQVIIKLAGHLQTELPKSALLARVGGEEFAVIFQQMPLDETAALLEKLRINLAEQPLEVEELVISVTASLGLAGYCEDGDLIACLKEADQALYQAKRRGRNQLVVRRVEKNHAKK
ncbi:diguanylate cyclase [Marinospirillum sp.]|uniref:diguanylate cyclase n=1 Tax=Marinospirillum sp. TaxID=2183934 RepID=UPI00384C6207